MALEKQKKKIRILAVLGELRGSSSSTSKSETEIEETLRSDHFQVCKTVCHGFPYQPTAVAFDPVQHLLAIGTKSGALRIFGRPGVDCHCRHEGDFAVIQVLFLVNEGALVTVCADDSLHLWNFRQKKPEIVHSLKFQRERITYCHAPFQSKWLYIGTERGNVHIVNIESFILSGYVINWNKAIELSRKTHPGPVVHLSDNPVDPTKLLIGFESGAVVFWDLRSKTADYRYNSPEALRSISWHHEGKQFMCSHTDGSLSTWNYRTPPKPCNLMMPHAKIGKDGKPDPCKPIAKVEWKSVRNGEPLVIFSGGMSYDKAGRTPSITVMNGKSTTVLEMEHNVVDFVVLCETPWMNDFQDPYGIVVLLQNDLVVVDLTSIGYPCFENPYPMDIHESPVTACQYYAACPPDLIPAFYSVGSKQKRVGFSEKGWPIQGGEWGTTACSYPEIVITGHADGSIKFWDASAATLQVLYKLKTAKMFEKPKSKFSEEEDPFAIQQIYLCQESRLLCVSGATHAMLFAFTKQESVIEVVSLDISIVYEVFDDLDSPEYDYPKPNLGSINQQSGSVGSYSSNTSDSNKDMTTSLKVKHNSRKWHSGYQPEVVCLLTWIDGEPPSNITSISFNSNYGLLAFGNECGLAIVDYLQKTCLFSMGTPDLYGSMDPYQRAPRSPRGKKPQRPDNQGFYSEECKSPTSDQLSPTVTLSPVQKTQPHEMFVLNDVQYVDPPGMDTVDSVQDSNRSPLSKSMSSPFHGPIRELRLSVPAVCPVMSVSMESISDADPFDSGLAATMPASMLKTMKATSTHSVSGPATPTAHSSKVTSPAEHKCPSNAGDNGPMRKASSNPDLNTTDCPPPRERSLRRKPGMYMKFRRKSKKSKSSCSSEPKDSDMECSPEMDTTACVVNGGASTADSESGMNTGANAMLGHDGESAERSGGTEDSTDGVARTFFQRMSLKLSSLSNRSSAAEDTQCNEKGRINHRKMVRDSIKIDVVDMSEDHSKPVYKRITIGQYLQLRKDKNDGSFSRSRSSSMSSLENVSKEAIQCLAFTDSFTRKTENFTCPCLWVGTSLGSVLVIVLNLPALGERLNQPVIVSPSGTIFRLKGTIQAMAFLDCNGVPLTTLSQQWRDTRDEKREKMSMSRQMSVSSSKARISPTSSTELSDRQFAIICSEKQARVMSLPSQTCTYKVKITETSFVVKADILLCKDTVCLACYVANGHIMTFSLPSLKPLLDIDFLPLTDYRVARTFCFSNNGHALYLSSPTEMQKIAYTTDICDNLNEMLGDLFMPSCEIPEAPKQGFFKNLFSSGGSVLDREELFGETSGKASKGLAKHIPGSGGLQQLQGQAGTLGGELSRARQALTERGEKLTETEERSAMMAAQAETYSHLANQLMNKYKDKKWYQF